MNRHTGAYYTATVEGSLMLVEQTEGQDMLFLTRDEALDLLEAINAVIGAMAVDIGTGKEVMR